MVADLLGSLSFENSDTHVYAAHHDFDAFEGEAEEFAEMNEEPQPTFVRGSVLDACAARDRVERAPLSAHIAVVDSDDNGLYRLFRNR